MSTVVRFVAVVFALLIGALVGAGPAGAQIHVDGDNTSGTQDGTSWSTAYAGLQTAINNASSGDEIWVAEGVYKPASSTESIAFSGAKDGPKMYGGFDETEPSVSSRDPEGNVAILSGDVGGQRITIRMATTLSRIMSTSTERTRRTFCI